MHFNFHFTAVQILWSLTFAALLVLLVVLLGRDRMRRFPWFSTSIVLVALRLLMDRLLHDRLPQLTLWWVTITLSDITALVSLLVLVEMARYAFRRVSRAAWMGWGLALLALGGIVLWKWGPWPNWKAISFDTPVAKLQLLQFLAVKTGLLTNVLAVALGMLIVAAGWRYGAGWRSHVQRIMIGISTAALAQMTVQAIWEIMVHHTAINSRAVYEHMMGVQGKLLNTNSVVYILVVIWWIICLWIDEPGNGSAQTANVRPVSADSGAPIEAGEA